MNSLPKAAAAQWYRITQWQLATTCQWCGMPLSVRDRVLEA
ncbi:hypothetical protein [Bythopirellula goksoeyrii]|uniref:Uncharacterized protein n=1 Tax=Bythopirellula goksoeyrii TaxID=1400387 RepID=A0A5B9QQ38_9BACT|nr:hypothetical protein [Bythopirellula goksoeyrii]QEG36083.1 hypothetical protein Pr1d_33920 [Bythopirellula goksoeyrii]